MSQCYAIRACTSFVRIQREDARQKVVVGLPVVTELVQESYCRRPVRITTELDVALCADRAWVRDPGLYGVFGKPALDLTECRRAHLVLGTRPIFRLVHGLASGVSQCSASGVGALKPRGEEIDDPLTLQRQGVSSRGIFCSTIEVSECGTLCSGGSGPGGLVTAENPDFSVERAFFSLYKEALEVDYDLLREVVEAIGTVLTRYNTVVWENRFIVGGVVEQIIGSSARSLGLEIRNAGKQNQGYDLELDESQGVGISIKGSFASTNGMHNLVNVRSPSPETDMRQRWTTATIFVMSNVGIGYTDPLFGRDFLNSSGDALQISGSRLKEWWGQNPQWLIVAPIPKKPSGTAMRVASDAVSFDIFSDFPRLRESWSAEI